MLTLPSSLPTLGKMLLASKLTLVCYLRTAGKSSLQRRPSAGAGKCTYRQTTVSSGSSACSLSCHEFSTFAKTTKNRIKIPQNLKLRKSDYDKRVEVIQCVGLCKMAVSSNSMLPTHHSFSTATALSPRP